MNFLPEDYQAPKSSNNYLKLQDGENRIRILSKPIIGWEDWKDKKPVRYEMGNKPAKAVDPTKPIKHFWAFIVFNYQEEQIQIMQITSANIRKSIEALCKDQDWGAPYFYDIKIMKSGELMNTKYAVNPVPHKPVDPYIVQCFKEKPCNLTAILTNADPFSLDNASFTKLAIEEVDCQNITPKIGVNEAFKLHEMLEECDPIYKEQIMFTLSKLPKPVKDLQDIPVDLFDRIKTAVQNSRDEYQKILKGSYSELAIA